MQKKYTNILVGGSGFIGSALFERLVEKGESVVSIARHSVESGLLGSFLSLDVGNRDSLKERFPQGEHAFLLVGQQSKTFEKNRELENLKNVIDVLNSTRPEKVFYCSSVLVYGGGLSPSKEEDIPHPIDEYSRFKYEAEELLRNSLHPSILLGILRLSNVYGDTKNQGFIGFIMRSILEHTEQELSINGDGKQERDYIFIDDVVAAMLAVRDQLNVSDTVNIAVGKSYSLVELVRCISYVTGKVLPEKTNGKKLHEVIASRISSEKLRTVYHFMPTFSLEDGLRETWKRYQISPTSSSFSDSPRQKLLLIGGEGFIGRNIASYLSERYDCFSLGRRPSVFSDRQDVFLKGDPYGESFSRDADIVIHLLDNKVAPERFEEEEQRLWEHLDLSSCQHLILFSSAVLYASPESDYGVRKRMLEQVYARYAKEHGLLCTILRPFNIFGPFQLPYRQGSLIANVMYNVLLGKETEIQDMDACRDFFYAPDIAHCIDRVIQEKRGGIYDIGSGHMVSIRELLALLENGVFNKCVDILDRRTAEHLPHEPAKNLLFSPVSDETFRENLRKTFQFYQENIETIRRYLKQ